MTKKETSTDTLDKHGVVFFIIFVFLLQLQPCYVAAQPNDRGRFAQTNENFKPSMTVTIVVLAVACVFIAFFSFYIRRCSRDIHINGGTSIRFNRTRPAPRGLESSVIETFPTFLYSVVKGLKMGKGVLECAVCLNEFEDDESIRLLPKCDHVFHPECIDAWLSSHTTCPVCRAELVAYQPDDKDGVVTPVSESEESDIRPLNQQNQLGSSSSVPEITQVVVDVDDLKTRFPRSKSMIKGIAGRFPRSHSTGHSVVQPDNHDRFTLRLPDDVRKQILSGKLSRTMSCVTTFQRQGSAWRNDSIRGSTRRSGRTNPFAAGGGATKSGRWGFLRSASFFWRSNGLARSSKKGDGGGGLVTAKSDSGSQSSSTVRLPPA